MTPEEILHKHVDKESMDELSKNVWPDIVDAMKEYAISVAREAVEEEKSTNKQLIDRLVRSTHAMESHPDYRYATLPKPSRHSQLFLDEVEINKIALRDAGVES